MTTLQLSLLPPDNSTSSPPDFPAKTFQVPTPTGEGWKVSDLDCSLKSSESFAQFSPDSFCLKTYQPSLTGDLTEFSGKLPKAGLMRNGKLYQRQAWVRLTKGNGFSLLPTPRSQEGSGGGSAKEAMKAINKVKSKGGHVPQLLLRDAVRLLPTPTVCGNHNYKGASATSGDGLATIAKLLPTPCAQDGKNGMLPPSQMNRDSVPGAVMQLLPTPKAMDGDRGSVGTITRFNNATGRKALKSAIGNLQPDPNQVKGQLNPEFVEWMQGYPLGWTELTPAPSPPESPTTKNA